MQTVHSYTLPPDKLAQAVHYARVHNTLHFAGVVISAIVLLALLKFRFVPRIREWNPALIVAAFLLIVAAFDLPGEMYSHSISLRYNISIQSWGSWFWDLAKGQLIGTVIGCLVLIPFYALLRASPQRWWLYGWAACIPVTILFTYAMPLIVEPMFDKFEPLATRHSDLIDPIERLLSKAGVKISRDRLFEMDASEKTNSLNAYVSGFGPSKRMVLYDTIIKKEEGPPLMTTIGHELGHYVLNHISKGMLFGWANILVVILALYYLVPACIARWGAPLDIRGVSDWASLPVFLLVALVLGFVSEPIGNAFSRAQEREADLFSLEVTHGIVPDPGQAAAQAFQIEGETDLEDPAPHPWIVFWTYSHPPIAERLKYSLAYRPWENGGRPQFVE